MDSPFESWEPDPHRALQTTPSGAHKHVSSAEDLPPWSVIFNAVGQPLGKREQPTDILVLGIGEDDAASQVYVVATTEARRSPRHAAILVKLFHEHYVVSATYTADASVLRVILSEWASAHATLAGNEDGSAAHEQWDTIVREAARVGASDVHLWASHGRGDVLYRINGDLEIQPLQLTQQQGMELAASMYNTMVDKGTTTGGFNPRIQQSAAVTRTYPSGRIRLRYESLPVEPDGINVTLRLIPLGATAKRKTPQELGYSPDQSEMLTRMFARASGMILFLGTTGSGKSTSMANLLMKLVEDNPGKLLRTVEEPVEIRIPGASQTSVARSATDDPNAEDPFIATLRSLLRSDPDYIMVGEIRDDLTANLAIQAVRSGHLCVSTLHSDGAPIAYDRLSGMGVKRSDLASVGLIAGLIYQRLVPVACPDCKVTARSVAGEAAYADVLGRLHAYITKHRPDLHDYLDRIYFRRPGGCDSCAHRGSKTRTVCAEILVPTVPMLDAIRNSDSPTLWKLWRDAIDHRDPSLMRGRTAIEHGRWKMTEGLLSPIDVERELGYLDEEPFQ